MAGFLRAIYWAVTRVPYLEELDIEWNAEKLNLARIALKRLQTPPNAMETEVIHNKKRQVDFIIFFPLF